MAEVTKQIRRINLHLYDTEMAVNIPADQEEFYRLAAKTITEVMNAYSSKYKGQKSEKVIMYMALLDITMRLEKEKSRTDVLPFDEILAELTSEIEEALQPKSGMAKEK